MKFILRIFVSTAVAVLIFVAFAVNGIKMLYQFVKYGGEFISYLPDDKPTIEKIYEQLKSQQKN